ncbi:flagellar hook-length control protein FliK [Methylobacterium sp. A54F]
MAVVGTDAVELFARRALQGTAASREAVRPTTTSFGQDLSRASEAAKARDAAAYRIRQQNQAARQQETAGTARTTGNTTRSTAADRGTAASRNAEQSTTRQERPEEHRRAATSSRSEATTRREASATTRSDAAKPSRTLAKGDARSQAGTPAETPEAADMREGEADRKAAEAAAAADLSDAAQSLAAADGVVASGLADPEAGEAGDEPAKETDPADGAVPTSLLGAMVALPHVQAPTQGGLSSANGTAPGSADAATATANGAKAAGSLAAATGERLATAGSTVTAVAHDGNAAGDGGSPTPVEASALPKPDFAAALGDAIAAPAAADVARDAGKVAPPAAPHAAAAASDRVNPQNVTPPVPLGQVPMTIGLRSLAGSSQFEIRLDPADLGRIDVKLDIDKERGTVMTHLVVERIETLAMLQRDAGSLQQALTQAGLDPSEGGINLSLRGDGAGGQGSAERDAQPRSAPRSFQDPDTRTTLDAAPLRTLRSLGGLDIRI